MPSCVCGVWVLYKNTTKHLKTHLKFVYESLHETDQTQLTYTQNYFGSVSFFLHLCTLYICSWARWLNVSILARGDLYDKLR